MSLDVNDQFLEEAIFAIADAYCVINLTKNLVPGSMYQVIDGKKYNLNKQLNLTENSSLDELVNALALTIPEEGRADFLKEFDRDNLLKRFENGERIIGFNYWTCTASNELMLAEDHMALYLDKNTNDVMAVNYVLDKTAQYHSKKQQDELKEKTRELERHLAIEKEYSFLLSALRNIYNQIIVIDLKNNTYRLVQAYKKYDENHVQNSISNNFVNNVKNFVADSYKDELLEFLDFNTISQRMSDTDGIFKEYLDINGNWYSSSFIVQDRDELNNPTKLLFTLRNINKEKEAELNQQRLDELKLQTMTEAIHGGFKIGKFDKDFTFIKVSEQLANLLGYDSADELMEASGGSMSGLVNHEDTVREMPDALKAVENGEMYTMNYRAKCKDGSWKNIEDRGRLIKNEKGEDEFWSFIVDNDEIVKTANALEMARRANVELENARNELKVARDLADAANKAKTQFLYNMSHDIRTPMNAIIGYSELMKNKLTDPELIHYQEMIEESGKILLSIINNVLDMSRIESGKIELDETYDNAGSIVEKTCQVYQEEAAKKNIKIEFKKDVKNKHILCDITKIEEIFTNLISNAIKYTPENGLIKVTTMELESPKKGYACIRTIVEDNGIGMSEKFLPRLFEPFSREKNTTHGKVVGTGLGMPIVKKYVDMMNGTIEVESKLGKGSKFTVTILHKIAKPEIVKKIKESSKEEVVDSFNGKKLLLVEDNEINAEIATLLLQELGFEIDRAEDGVVCINKYVKENKDYNLILMDIQMPNMDGYTATKIIRNLKDNQRANIPIIAMTANAFKEDKDRCLKAGMNEHLAKPLNIELLKSVLNKYLKN